MLVEVGFAPDYACRIYPRAWACCLSLGVMISDKRTLEILKSGSIILGPEVLEGQI